MTHVPCDGGNAEACDDFYADSAFYSIDVWGRANDVDIHDNFLHIYRDDNHIRYRNTHDHANAVYYACLSNHGQKILRHSGMSKQL
jgi:hypothetical protein